MSRVILDNHGIKEVVARQLPSGWYVYEAKMQDGSTVPLMNRSSKLHAYALLREREFRGGKSKLARRMSYSMRPNGTRDLGKVVSFKIRKI